MDFSFVAITRIDNNNFYEYGRETARPEDSQATYVEDHQTLLVDSYYDIS